MSIINSFFENFYQVFPNWFLHGLVLFCIFFWIYVFILLIIILIDALYKYYLTIYNCENKGFINPTNNQTLFLPLIYKVYSPIITCMKILVYIFFSVILVFLLRYLNLKKDLNLNLALINLSSMPLFYKILFCLLITCYILAIVLYFKNIYLRLFLELKRLYLYLYQFGGQLDPNSNYYFFFNSNTNISVPTPYILTLFLLPLYYNSPIKFHGDLVRILRNGFLDFNYEKENVSKVSRPLLYFVRYSKYKSSIFVKYLRYILTQILENFWTILKVIPIISLSIYFFISIFMHNGVFYKVYMILLIIYIYTLYINIIFFLDHNGKHLESGVCLLYYKFDYIKTITKIVTVYDQELIELYLKTINKKNSTLLKIYLKNELNFDKSILIYHSKPEIRSDIGKHLEKLKNHILNYYLIKTFLKKLLNFLNKL